MISKFYSQRPYDFSELIADEILSHLTHVRAVVATPDTTRALKTQIAQLVAPSVDMLFGAYAECIRLVSESEAAIATIINSFLIREFRGSLTKEQQEQVTESLAVIALHPAIRKIMTSADEGSGSEDIAYDVALSIVNRVGELMSAVNATVTVAEHRVTQDFVYYAVDPNTLRPLTTPIDRQEYQRLINPDTYRVDSARRDASLNILYVLVMRDRTPMIVSFDETDDASLLTHKEAIPIIEEWESDSLVKEQLSHATADQAKDVIIMSSAVKERAKSVVSSKKIAGKILRVTPNSFVISVGGTETLVPHTSVPQGAIELSDARPPRLLRVTSDIQVKLISKVRSMLLPALDGPDLPIQRVRSVIDLLPTRQK